MYVDIGKSVVLGEEGSGEEWKGTLDISRAPCTEWSFKCREIAMLEGFTKLYEAVRTVVEVRGC
jgi:hypothetical protein